MFFIGVSRDTFGLGMAVTAPAACNVSQGQLGAPGTVPGGTIRAFARTSSVLLMLAASTLVGCGSNSGSQTNILTGYIQRSATSAAKAPSGSSRSSSSDLIYIAGVNASYVVSYGEGKLVGTISSGAVGACSDKSGNVFLVEGNQVAEYAHGGTTPIKSLNLGSSAAGSSCSVDPTTGNLAVTLANGSSPEVAVFQSASGPPTTYDDPQGVGFCGYDDQGDLFVDGFGSNGIAIAELPKGGSSLTEVNLDKVLQGNPWQVQWAGSYLAVESVYGKNGTIYRLSISGSSATLVGKTKLTGARHPRASWINGNRILVPYGPRRNGSSKVGFWRYPVGGRASRVIGAKDLGSDLSPFNAVTISIASK